MYTANHSQPREAVQSLKHSWNTVNQRTKIRRLSFSHIGDATCVPLLVHRPSVEPPNEPPRRDPWWAPGRAPQSSSPVEPPRRLNNLEVVLRICTTLHKLTKAITKRVSFMSWNDLGRENLCSHVDHPTRFLRNLHMTINDDLHLDSKITGSGDDIWCVRMKRI